MRSTSEDNTTPPAPQVITPTSSTPSPADSPAPAPEPTLSAVSSNSTPDSNPTPTPTPSLVPVTPLDPSPSSSLSPEPAEEAPPAATSMPPSVTAGTDRASATIRPATPTPIVSGKPKSGKPKWFLPIVILVIILLGGAAAAYEGYYVPNQPSNVWKTALQNTSGGYDQLVNYLHTQTAVHYKGFSETGSFKADITGLAADGSINGSTDGSNATFTANIDAAGTKLGANVRAIKASGNDEPDLYLQLTGLKALSASTGLNLDSLDGQWVVIDHTMLDSLKSEITRVQSTPTTKPSLTSSDVIGIFTAIGNANKQYVWTTDSSKATESVSKDVGKETQDGRSVYHYKVNFNKANLKAYITALRNNVNSSAFGTWLKATTGKNIDSYIDYPGMLAAADRVKPTDTIDVWVDMGTKTIHKVRFTDSSNTNNYFDAGLNYTGGSQYPLTFDIHDKQGSTVTTASLTATLDTKANSLALVASLGQAGDAADQLSLNLTFKPSNNAVNVSAPAGAVPITQILEELGLSNLLSSGSGAGSAAPTSSASPSGASGGLSAQCDTALQNYVSGSTSTLPPSCIAL